MVKYIVTLSGTLLCPGTQIDNTYELRKKYQPINDRTSHTEINVPHRELNPDMVHPSLYSPGPI